MKLKGDLEASECEMWEQAIVLMSTTRKSKIISQQLPLVSWLPYCHTKCIGIRRSRLLI